MRLLPTMLLAVVAWLALASTATANTYVVYACKGPNGQPAPTDGLSAVSFAAPVGTTTDSCASGGSLAASLAANVQQPSDARVSWRYSAPADTDLRSFEVWRTGRASVHSSDTSQSPAQYTSFPGPSWSSDRRDFCTPSCRTRGTDLVPLDPTNYWASGPLSGVREAWFSAGCVGGGACAARGGATDSMARMTLYAARWTLADERAPAGTGSGALLGAGPHRGVETARIAATDQGSGLLKATLELKAGGETNFSVEQTVTDDNNGRCAEIEGANQASPEYGYGVPCRLSDSIDLALDTTTKPDGLYSLRVRLEDASGNVTTVRTIEAFEVDNVFPPSASTMPSVAGQPTVGLNLTGERGEWIGSGISYAYAWLRCSESQALDRCDPIPGATSASYGVTAADAGSYLRYRVTATNANGSGTAHSPATARVAGGPPPSPTPAPTTSPAPTSQCSDGIDNDGDGAVDMADSGCVSPQDTSEGGQNQTQGNPSGGGTGSGGGGGGGGGSPSGGGGGANASAQARLSIAGSARRSLRYGRGALTYVSLRDEEGRAVAGATVHVLQRMTVPGASFVAPHPPLTTDADGRIRYPIEPGFSRTLRFAYAARKGEGYTATRDLQITVKSRTSLSTDRSYLRNGQAVTFNGRLASRPVPRVGVVIDLQAQVGRRWQTFKTLRTSEEGRWSAKYRFRSTTGLQTYTFRARVRGDSGYPYSPSTSRQVKVQVRG